MALAVASVAVARGDGQSRLVRIVVERPGLCWLGAGAAFVALTALLRPGGLFGIAQALATQQPIAKTLAAIALGAVLHTLLVAPAVFGDHAGGVPRRVLATAPLAWLGLVSYGVYLWHLTVAELLGLPADRGHFRADGLDLVGRIHHLDTPILFVATLAVSTAIAAASYYLVELPFLRLKER
jgi:peptidoglycan/LPS O-acetylase OafA/YrhL